MLSNKELTNIKKYFRAVNYIAAAQIFLADNFFLEEPLQREHIKKRPLGHWGTCPGINFVYTHLNHYLARHKENMLYVVGPGHGFPAIQANLFMEETLSTHLPDVPFSREGLERVIHDFSWPYGYPSHANPGAPGTILEGGELGYSLSTSYGAALDHKDLIVACLVGDGEAETGPLATAWQANKLLSPKDSGAVLPILHLNGYKISGPTMYARMSDEELEHTFTGLGYDVYFVEYDETNPDQVHHDMAKTLEECTKKIHAIWHIARSGQEYDSPRWPMIVMRTPKGWTGIKKLPDGTDAEGNFASHQTVVTHLATSDAEFELLKKWLESYEFLNLFDPKKGFGEDLLSIRPPKKQRLGMNPITYGGEVSIPLRLPNTSSLSINVEQPGKTWGKAMRRVGDYLEEVFEKNMDAQNFRLFSPDETYSNRLDDVFKETERSFQWPLMGHDQDISRNGRVMEMLSEHTLQGMMQGYVITGRHGVFASYEAFIQIVSSMADQYAKFVKASMEFPFREAIPSFNYLLSSLGWRQDHNGYSHQNPGFISNILEKHGNLASVYFPVDTNSALAAMEECLGTTHGINLMVCSKQEHLQWLTYREAKKQLEMGIGIWEFASDPNPDIVFSSAGDLITVESLAAVSLLKKHFPSLRIRYVNISELTAIGVGDPRSQTNQEAFDMYFTKDKPVIFNYHGYPADVKHLIFDSVRDTSRWSIHGYLEQGSTTTPFDMMVRNKTSRYHLAEDAVRQLQKQGVMSVEEADIFSAMITKKLKEHHGYIIAHGIDPEELTNWTW